MLPGSSVTWSLHYADFKHWIRIVHLGLDFRMAAFELVLAETGASVPTQLQSLALALKCPIYC